MIHRFYVPLLFAIASICSSQPATAGGNFLFGDSIAYGLGSTPGHDLGTCLDQTLGTPFVNVAVPGATSRDALVRLSKLNAPETVVLSVGGNDLLVDLNHMRDTRRWEHVFPARETRANLRAIFGHFRTLGTRVVYLDMSPPLKIYDPRSVYANLDGRLRAIRSIAADFDNVTVVGYAMKGIWGHHDRLWDTLHPNDSGYAILCRRIREALATSTFPRAPNP